MRVGINARSLANESLRGSNRHIVNLVGGLAELGVDMVLYGDQPFHANHTARLPASNCRVSISPSMGRLRWEQMWLPGQCKRDGVDVFHSISDYAAPYFCQCPRVITMAADLKPAQAAEEGADAKVRRDQPINTGLSAWAARKKVQRFIVVSQRAKTCLETDLKIAPDKIRLVPEAADSIFTKPVNGLYKFKVRKEHDLEHPFILYVGGWQKRKNVPLLLKAFALAEVEETFLVIAGGKQEQRAELRQLAESLNLGDKMKLLGMVSDAELAALYACAYAFAYPSEHDGFGMRICEAMAMGKPTLVAKTKVVPEALGDGGVTFTPDDPLELSQLIHSVVYDLAYREELEAKARKRSAELTWLETARKTLAVYAELCPGKA